jgi:ribosomal protein L27
VAAELAATGLIEVRQRGIRVDPATATGALRLARGPAWPED